jgi:hypothetical protein
VILSLTQLYYYTPEIFLFSTATFKYKYRGPLRRILTLHLRGDDHDGIVKYGRSREFRMHMKNPAQTGSDFIRFSDWKIENATFAEYSCPIRLRGPRYLYLNVAVEKRNISGV